MAEIEVTREHRLAVWRDCHAGYEPHEDSVVGRWVAGLPVSVDMAEHDRVAQAIAAAELRGKRALIAEIEEATRGHGNPVDWAEAAGDVLNKYQPTEGET